MKWQDMPAERTRSFSLGGQGDPFAPSALEEPVCEPPLRM
jgi:hypothetical protein